MRFIDYDGLEIDLKGLFAEWQQGRVDSYNFPESFLEYVFDVLEATTKGRNDMFINGMTSKEIAGVMTRIWRKLQ